MLCKFYCLFIQFMRFSQQAYWGSLPFPPPVDHVLSELSTTTCLSWVAWHGMAHSFIELYKLLHHEKAVAHEREMVRDSKAWHAAVHWVSKSRTWLGDLRMITKVLLERFSKGGSWPAVSTSFGKILRPHPRCAESEILGWGAQKPLF